LTFLDKSPGPVALAAYVMVGINAIHPFLDGNGRVSRLLASSMIIHAQYAGFDFGGYLERFLRKRQDYFSAIRNDLNNVLDHCENSMFFRCYDMENLLNQAIEGYFMWLRHDNVPSSLWGTDIVSKSSNVHTNEDMSSGDTMEGDTSQGNNTEEGDTSEGDNAEEGDTFSLEENQGDTRDEETMDDDEGSSSY